MAGGPEGRTKAERMATGSIFTFVSMVVIRLATVVNSVVIVRALGVFDVGVFSIVNLTISVAAVVAGFGISSALVKFLAEVPADHPEDASQLMRVGIVLTILATAFSVGALVILLPLFAVLYGGPEIPILLLIGSVGLVLGALPGPLLATFQAYELIRERSIVNVVSAVLSVPATVVLVVLWGLTGAVLATVASSGIAIGVNFRLIRIVWRARKLSWRVSVNPSVRRKIFGYAVPTLLGALVVTFVLWFTSTYLAAQASFDEVGLYSIGSSLASYLLFVPSAIGVPFIPIVSRLDRSASPELPPFLMRTLRVTAFLLIPPTLVLIAFPEPFLSLLFGPAFVNAALIVDIVAPAVFLAGISTIVGFGIAGKGHMWHGLLVNLLWAVVFVAASFVLVPTEAAAGLSLGYLAAYAVQFLGILAYVRYSWSISVRPLILPVGIAAVSSSVLLSARYLAAGPWTGPAMAVFIMAVTVAEFLAMSRRELEVLSTPIRRLIQ